MKYRTGRKVFKRGGRDGTFSNHRYSRRSVVNIVKTLRGPLSYERCAHRIHSATGSRERYGGTTAGRLDAPEPSERRRVDPAKAPSDKCMIFFVNATKICKIQNTRYVVKKK